MVLWKKGGGGQSTWLREATCKEGKWNTHTVFPLHAGNQKDAVVPVPTMWASCSRRWNVLRISHTVPQESHQVARMSTFSDAGGSDKEPESAPYPVISNSLDTLCKLWILPEQTSANHFLACETQGWHSKFTCLSVFTRLLGPSCHWYATGVREEREIRVSKAAAPPGSLNRGKTAFAQCMGSDIIKLASQEQKRYIRKETGTRASPYKANRRAFLEQYLCLKNLSQGTPWEVETIFKCWKKNSPGVRVVTWI